MTRKTSTSVALTAALIFGAVVQRGGSARADHRHRRVHAAPYGPVFDRRPALSQATVGSLSLQILAAGAAEALAAEDEYASWLPFDFPPPAYRYGAP